MRKSWVEEVRVVKISGNLRMLGGMKMLASLSGETDAVGKLVFWVTAEADGEGKGQGWAGGRGFLCAASDFGEGSVVVRQLDIKEAERGDPGGEVRSMITLSGV